MTDFIKYIELNKFDKKDYQIEGVDWCINREKEGYMVDNNKIYGGILADEMGLGKTIQMMGVILNNFKLHTLIVLPYSLLSQWNSFFISTANHTPLIYHRKYKNISLQQLKSSPIVITTYGILSNTKSLLNKLNWDRIIYDEAHYIRNKKTLVYKSIIKMKSKISWLVTGTPILNDIKDIYNLLSIFGINQKLFLNNNDFLKIILSKLLLKRTKKSIHMDLPDVVKHINIIEWDNAIDKNISRKIHLDSLSSDITVRLPSYIKSRKSCIHIREKHNSDKINKFMDIILSNKSNNKKKIIFCNFHNEIDFIYSLLERNDFNVQFIDGRVSSSKRFDILNDESIDVLILQINTGSEGLNLQTYSEIYFISPYWTPFIEEQAIARCHRIGQQNIIHVYYFIMQKFITETESESESETKTSSIYNDNIENHILSLHQKKININQDLFN